MQQPQRSLQRPRDAASNRQNVNGTAPSPTARTVAGPPPRESRDGLRTGSVSAAASRQLKGAFARAEERPLQAAEKISRPYPGPSAATQPGLPQAGTSPAAQGTPANWNGRWGQSKSHRKAPASVGAPDGARSAAIWQRTQRKAPAGVPRPGKVGAKRSDVPPQQRSRPWPAGQSAAQAAAAQGRPPGQQRPTAAPAATANAVALGQGLTGAAAGPQAAGGWQSVDSAGRYAEPAPWGQESLGTRGRHKSLAASAGRDTSQPVSSRKAASACTTKEAEASTVSPHLATVAAQNGGISSHAAGEHHPEEGLPAKVAALLSAADAAAAEADAQALALEQALEMVENQLPQWAHQQNLDWGATAAHEPMVRLQDGLKCGSWQQHSCVCVVLSCLNVVSTAALPDCCPCLLTRCRTWQCHVKHALSLHSWPMTQMNACMRCAGVSCAIAEQPGCCQTDCAERPAAAGPALVDCSASGGGWWCCQVTCTAVACPAARL